jgi:quercetin dioxygenase-like cupin family protein
MMARLRVCVPPDTTGCVLTSIETTNAPGFGPPLHRHPETEVLYVLEGRYLFEVDGKRFTADTGNVVTAPGGSAHTFVNITSAPARQFIEILPGLDAVAFFRGLGDVMRDGTLDQDGVERVREGVARRVSRPAAEGNGVTMSNPDVAGLSPRCEELVRLEEALYRGGMRRA